MKRILAIVITICLILSLAGCGGSPASEVNNNEKTATEQSEKPAGDSSSISAQGETQEVVINTGLIESGGDVTAKTGGSITWDPDKMGGMPQPDGVTIFMEMDLSETLGKELAYSYSVTGLTREVYQEYIKLVSDTFPKVIENTFNETEGTFLATTEDYGKQFHVRFLEGKLSIIQYID